MEYDNKNLKTDLDRFICSNSSDFEEKRVDYLGVNIFPDEKKQSVFKIYYNDSASRTKSHPLIDFLKRRGMIRFLTMVQDRTDPHRLRFDVGLKNRTNENMLEVFKWLSEHTWMFERNSSEIRKLSAMKATELENHDFAALYFLGFISYDEEIAVLKCHFFNRICEDPDVLHKNFIFSDEYYLSFLSNSSIGGFAELSDLLKKALRHCGGHLWMTGADYTVTSSEKYKIYVKNPDNPYTGLMAVFGEEKDRHLCEQIRNLMEWNDLHREYFCEGFAVCLDMEAAVSVNFYFRQKGRRNTDESSHADSDRTL